MGSKPYNMVCPTGLLRLFASVTLTITSSSGIAQTASQSATCAKTLREAAAEDRAVGDMLDAEARYQETHGGELSPALFDKFVKWHSPKSAQDPDRYPPLLRMQLSPVDQLKRRFAIEDFMQDYMQEVRDGMDARKAGRPRVPRSEGHGLGEGGADCQFAWARGLPYIPGPAGPVRNAAVREQQGRASCGAKR